jgi:RHS repeat-associated protein
MNHRQFQLSAGHAPVAGAADVFGFADPDATVSVDGQRATHQADGYFHRAAPVANSASAAQGKFNVRGIKNFAGANSEDAQRDEVRTAFVPKTPEVFTYDLDGNLTSDERFTYTWDAEKRLVSVEALANLPAGAKTKAQYSYDGFSRRISKKAWRWIDAGSGSQPSAVFVKEDAFTLGNWNAPYAGYGSQGDRLIGGHAVADTVSYPSYATVTTSGAFAYTWAATTTESRALNHGAQRVAGCWASWTNFTIQVNITDGLPHRVGFYCLDWDGAQTRQQEIEVRDAVTHALLDRQTVREFSNGRYLFWNITGNVKFVFVNTGAINAVVSGLFFDPATTGYQPSADQRYLYDGWNLLSEQDYNPVTGSYVPGQRYTWGLDLSGTMQGAGGVGGLLAIHPAPATSSSSFVPAYDGNGNLTTLIRTTDRTVAAAYEYGPFGEPIRATGAMANANPFRFSTKYTDSETGFLYYGYRFYQPQTGRWLSRDVILEQGGLSLYSLTKNDIANYSDFLGLNDLVLTIVRNSTNAYQTLGTFNLIPIDEKVKKCCGSVSGSTIEPASGRYVRVPGRTEKNYPIPASENYTGRITSLTQGGGQTNTGTENIIDKINKNTIASVNEHNRNYPKDPRLPSLIALPPDMYHNRNLDFTNEGIVTSEMGGDTFELIRGHIGTSSCSSEGCIIFGQTPRTIQSRTPPYIDAPLKDGSYPLASWPWGESISKLREVIALNDCVEKNIGRTPRISIRIRWAKGIQP